MPDELKPFDEEINALDWLIAAIKSRPRLFGKPNAEAVRCLENLLVKLKKQQKLSSVDNNGKNWKPTKEHVEAIAFAIQDSFGRSYHKNLLSLYNDIQKL